MQREQLLINETQCGYRLHSNAIMCIHTLFQQLTTVCKHFSNNKHQK